MKPIRFDQTLNLAEFGRFFSHRTPIFHFLSLTFVVALLMVIFGDSTALIARTTQRSAMAPLSQVAISAVVGYALLVGSRLLLAYALRHWGFTLTGLLMWIAAELIVIVAVMSLVLWALSGAGALQLAPLVGLLAVNTLVIMIVPYSISALAFRASSEHSEVMRLRAMLAEGDAQSFLRSAQPQESNLQFKDRANKLVFSIAQHNLLYIEAADNYVNIHYLNEGHEDTFILHNTMKQIEDQFSDSPLMRCHRSYIINTKNVKLLRKEGANLVVELSGTLKTLPVTKTYAQLITARLTNAE